MMAMSGNAIHHTTPHTTRMLWKMPPSMEGIWIDGRMVPIYQLSTENGQSAKSERPRTGLGFSDAISAVIHAFKKIAILEIDKDGVLLEEALLVHVDNNIVRLERTLGLQNLCDNLARGSRLIAMFLETIHAATNEHKATVFDELVVHGRRLLICVAMSSKCNGSAFFLSTR